MKKKILTGAVVAVVIFLLALPKLGLFGSKEANPAGGQAKQPKLPVEGHIVKTAQLDNKLVITGSILANESLELQSEVSGKITGIYFKEGSRVKRGDLLIQINDEEIRAQLDKQKHNIKLNEDNEFRQRKLLEKDAISQEEYDNALNRLNTTVSDIRLLEAQLEKTRIIAPFDGTIGLRYVSPGAYISPSSAIATLFNINPAKLEFAVPARYSTQLTQGKKVYFTIESNPKRWQGEVYAIEPQIDPNTRALKIRAVADNSEGLLLPGQFVRVELILETITNAVLIPTQAIIQEMEGPKVFISRNGKAERIDVTTGIRTDRELEILSGLNTGDTLITTGLLQIRQGIQLEFLKVN
ncbi:MAG: efflux RND transporter periplasmic adaptor subunit [Cyclobacteriaceae bacterium]|nr:efflux RND transporter periplasmic adaptor subunit [Cyclobacteriaceae bacterium]